MAKYIPGVDPKTRAEKYWYAKGFSQGLQGRIREIETNKANADATWAQVNMDKSRLKGIAQLTRSLHDLIETALGRQY